MKRVISDPYLSAFLFLTLKVKLSPIVEDSGRVAFEFPDDEATEEAIKRFHSDEQVSAFTYSGAIKSVKSIIFGVKSKVRQGVVHNG